MNRIILVLSLFIGLFTYGQVGINTTTPSATLDIVTKDATSSTKALEVNNSAATEMLTVLNNGNVGINQPTPTNPLHVKATSDPIKLEGLQTSDSYSGLLAVDANGVVKALSGSSFSTTNSGNRILRTNGGSNLLASVPADFPNNTITKLVLNVSYDPLASYDTTTGEYTIPSDGIYHMRFVINLTVNTSSGAVFNGDSGHFDGFLRVDGGVVCFNRVRVLQGTKVSGGDNLNIVTGNSTVFLKKGQKVYIDFYAYGLSNMDPDLSKIYVDKSQSALIITKLF